MNVSILKQMLDFIKNSVRCNSFELTVVGDKTDMVYTFKVTNKFITLIINDISLEVVNADMLNLKDSTFTVRTIVELINNADGRLYERRETYPNNTIPLWVSFFKILGDKVDLRFVDKSTGKEYLGRHCKGKVLFWISTEKELKLFIGTLYKIKQWNSNFEIESFGISANKAQSNADLINSLRQLCCETNKQFVEVKL